MQSVIRIGSRESALAVAQAELVRQEIERRHPEVRTELVTMKTTGDKILGKSLEAIGGKGLFVKELDQALCEGKIDISVHSLKDMPMEISDELPILAFSARGDARDVLIYKPGREELPKCPVIGTSSRRRMMQMKKLFPDASFAGIRGNVQTRLRKLAEENYDGTILAAAGLERLGMNRVAGRYFSVEEMIPAAGQGILAIQGRKGEDVSWLEGLNSPESQAAALAERQFVRALDGGCTSPVAAYAKVAGREIHLTGLYYDESEEWYFTDSVAGNVDCPEALGEKLALTMRKKADNR